MGKVACRMPHAQARVAAIFGEVLGTAPVLNQEPGKALFRTFPILIRIHGANHVVFFDLVIKAMH